METNAPSFQFPLTNAALAARALQIAISQLGQQERPAHDNHGPMVDKYLASVGLNPGYSWCQAFVHWCYEQAAKELNQGNPVVHTAGVLNCWNKTAVQQKLTQEDALKHPLLIKPGDQFVLDEGHGNGHTGIIERVEGLVLHTIEGNSNNNGSREGYEVVRHARPLNSVLLKGIIKYS